MDLMTGLSAVSQALGIAKKLKEFEDEFKNAEFKLQIAELYSSLADVKIALADAKIAIQDRDEEIASLKAKADNRLKTVSYKGYNFGIDADGKPIGRPYCPKCEQVSGLQIQISHAMDRHDMCPSCKAIYSDNPKSLPSSLLPTL